MCLYYVQVEGVSVCLHKVRQPRLPARYRSALLLYVCKIKTKMSKKLKYKWIDIKGRERQNWKCIIDEKSNEKTSENKKVSRHTIQTETCEINPGFSRYIFEAVCVVLHFV